MNSCPRQHGALHCYCCLGIILQNWDYHQAAGDWSETCCTADWSHSSVL